MWKPVTCRKIPMKIPDQTPKKIKLRRVKLLQINPDVQAFVPLLCFKYRVHTLSITTTPTEEFYLLHFLSKSYSSPLSHLLYICNPLSPSSFSPLVISLLDATVIRHKELISHEEIDSCWRPRVTHRLRSESNKERWELRVGGDE